MMKFFVDPDTLATMNPPFLGRGRSLAPSPSPSGPYPDAHNTNDPSEEGGGSEESGSGLNPDMPALLHGMDLGSLWAYEGVVLPGGEIVVGRWWCTQRGGSEGGGVSAEGEEDVYSGPFMFWCVD